MSADFYARHGAIDGNCDGCRKPTTRRSRTRWTADTGWQWGHLCEACAFGKYEMPQGGQMVHPRVQVAAQAVREAMDAFPVDPVHEGWEKRQALEDASRAFGVPAGEIACALRNGPRWPQMAAREQPKLDLVGDPALTDEQRAQVDCARLELFGYALDGYPLPPTDMGGVCEFEPPPVPGWVTEAQWWLAQQAAEAWRERP